MESDGFVGWNSLAQCGNTIPDDEFFLKYCVDENCGECPIEKMKNYRGRYDFNDDCSRVTIRGR